MNYEALLALISDLYVQVTTLQKQNEELKQELKALDEKLDEKEAGVEAGFVDR